MTHSWDAIRRYKENILQVEKGKGWEQVQYTREDENIYKRWNEESL